jgi:hypothetical protein
VSLQCGNSATTGVFLTLNDSQNSYVYVGPTKGEGYKFEPPLVSNAVNVGITVVADTAQTTVKCSAQGYKGA